MVGRGTWPFCHRINGIKVGNSLPLPDRQAWLKLA
jgi:hypothetical protein